MNQRPFMSNAVPIKQRSFDKTTPIYRMIYRNPMHAPDHKSVWELNDSALTGSFTVHETAGWLEISITQTYDTGKRIMTRSISETLSREHALKLARFIINHCEEKDNEERN